MFNAAPDVARLKQSLSQLLSHYPHLAGRMVKGEEVSCSNAGVPFAMVSQTDLGIADIQSDFELVNHFARFPDLRRVRQGKEAMLTVTFTELRDGAVLSVCCLHALMDGNSFYTMIANWGRICAAREVRQPVIDQNLAPRGKSRSKAEAIRAAVASGWARVSIFRLLWNRSSMLGVAKMTRTAPISISAQTMRELKQSALQESGVEWLSTNDVLSSHIARMCAQLFGHSGDTQCSLIIVLDARQRTSTPANFAGNAVSYAKGAKFFPSESIAEIAKRNHECLAPFLAKPSSALEHELSVLMDMLEHKAPYAPYDGVATMGPNPTIFYINNFCKFPIYEVDFGDQSNPRKPVLVIPHDLPDPILIWPVPPTVGGVEVYLHGHLAIAARNQEKDSRWWKELLHPAPT